jgi:DNA polymerase
VTAGLDADLDPHAELVELVREVRALVEWHGLAGSIGLPVERSATARAPAAPSIEPREVREAAPARAQAPAIAEGSPPAGRVAIPSARDVVTEEPSWRARPAPAATRPTTLLTDAPLPLDERRRRLELVAENVRACSRCELAGSRTQTVFARGNPMAELVFVGEGPGEDEDREGVPFVGRAGQLLDKMIGAMGLGPDEFYIANVVKCRPPQNRTPEPLEMASCLPYLAEQLELVRPKAIVALGGTALRGLLGATEGITRARGSWKLYRGTIPVMPTFHPSYVLRQPTREVKEAVWRDLQEVVRHLGRTLPKRGGA